MRANWPRVLVTAMLVPLVAPAVTIGNVDTFEDGTTMGWHVGMPLPFTPLNITTGGPGGAGDSFMQLTATGVAGQPGSRLSVLNTSSNWTGNYLGIPAIQMDVNNFGPDDLSLRLLFEDLAGLGPPVNLALTNAAFIPANSGWRRISFSIEPADLIGTPFGTITGALMNTDTLRMFHNPGPFFFGPPDSSPVVDVVLGVDNIAPVPEPSTVALLGLGLTAMGAWRRYRRA
jgi:hypothetical protein